MTIKEIDSRLDDFVITEAHKINGWNYFLKFMRDEDWGKYEAAKQLKVKPDTIYRLMKTKKPSKVTLIKIAALVKLPLRVLVNERSSKDGYYVVREGRLSADFLFLPPFFTPDDINEIARLFDLGLARIEKRRPFPTQGKIGKIVVRRLRKYFKSGKDLMFWLDELKTMNSYEYKSNFPLSAMPNILHPRLIAVEGNIE